MSNLETRLEELKKENAILKEKLKPKKVLSKDDKKRVQILKVFRKHFKHNHIYTYVNNSGNFIISCSGYRRGTTISFKDDLDSGVYVNVGKQFVKSSPLEIATDIPLITNEFNVVIEGPTIKFEDFKIAADNRGGNVYDVLLTETGLVSTDKRALVHIKSDLGLEQSITLKDSVVDILLQLKEDFKVFIKDDESLYIETTSARLFVVYDPSIDSIPIKWLDIVAMDDFNREITFNTKTLLKAIKSFKSKYGISPQDSVKLVDNKLVYSEFSSEPVFSGNDIELKFPYKYIYNLVSCIDVEDAELNINTDTHVCKLKTDKLTYVVMADSK